MDASQQKELLLCALKHFDIDVLEANSQCILLHNNYAISLADTDTPHYQLLQAGRPGESFSDVVKLCTFIKIHLDLNEEVGVKNSSAGKQ